MKLSLSLASMFAPFPTRYLITLCLLLALAMCSGVCRALFRLSTLAPAWIRLATLSWLPMVQARWSGKRPSSLQWLTFAP